ncbi:hypothetical protein [Bradyrhizobium genosp. P]|uniref:hypothetical protein n=1 Tax=Bradyrhizobium genosp. P TaxID=83641 RepID=UPI003CE88A9C
MFIGRGAPDVLYFTSLYAALRRNFQRRLIRASKQSEEKSPLSANSLVAGFLRLFRQSEIGFARKQSISATDGGHLK